MNDIINKSSITTTQIDYIDLEKYDMVKKYVRFYERTLNQSLINEKISIDGKKPVSRAWIKFYEILYITQIFDNLDNDINVFHICEAPGTFIMSALYYLNKWNPNIKYNWNATSLNPKYLDKNGIGDTYGLLKKYMDKWSFGKDDTGDISKPYNIKFYNKLCSDRDWIIGDCGLPYSIDSKPGVLLYYAQMLFILYNLKIGGGCIFKQVLNFHSKLLIDMFYIIYASFDKVQIYKPVQNEFSPEFFVICSGYNKILSDDQFNTMFNILNDDNIINASLFNSFEDDFIYQFSNILDNIINGFNKAIQRQLFYTDFWDTFSNSDKNIIKTYIDVKNKDWIKHFIYRN